MNRPDFNEFYKLTIRGKSIYKNNKTEKLYIEKNANRNRGKWELILCISPLLALLISCLTIDLNKYPDMYLTLSLLLGFLNFFVIYPLRYYVVEFIEYENKNDSDDININVYEKIVLFGYLLINVLVYYIVLTYKW